MKDHLNDIKGKYQGLVMAITENKGNIQSVQNNENIGTPIEHKTEIQLLSGESNRWTSKMGEKGETPSREFPIRDIDSDCPQNIVHILEAERDAALREQFRLQAAIHDLKKQHVFDFAELRSARQTIAELADNAEQRDDTEGVRIVELQRDLDAAFAKQQALCKDRDSVMRDLQRLVEETRLAKKRMDFEQNVRDNHPAFGTEPIKQRIPYVSPLALIDEAADILNHQKDPIHPKLADLAKHEKHEKHEKSPRMSSIKTKKDHRYHCESVTDTEFVIKTSVFVSRIIALEDTINQQDHELETLSIWHSEKDEQITQQKEQIECLKKDNSQLQGECGKLQQQLNQKVAPKVSIGVCTEVSTKVSTEVSTENRFKNKTQKRIHKVRMSPFKEMKMQRQIDELEKEKSETEHQLHTLQRSVQRLRKRNLRKQNNIDLENAYKQIAEKDGKIRDLENEKETAMLRIDKLQRDLLRNLNELQVVSMLCDRATEDAEGNNEESTEESENKSHGEVHEVIPENKRIEAMEQSRPIIRRPPTKLQYVPGEQSRYNGGEMRWKGLRERILQRTISHANRRKYDIPNGGFWRQIPYRYDRYVKWENANPLRPTFASVRLQGLPPRMSQMN